MAYPHTRTCRRSTLHPLRPCPLLRHEAGATLIEFAFVFPILILLIMGAFEFFFVMFLRGGVETTLHETARRAMTGALYGQEGARDELLLAELKRRLDLVLLGDQEYELKTDVYDAFQSVSSGSSQTATPSFGGSSQIIRYTIRYAYTYQTPLAALVGGLGNETVITSSVFIRNEDF